MRGITGEDKLFVCLQQSQERENRLLASLCEVTATAAEEERESKSSWGLLGLRVLAKKTRHDKLRSLSEATSADLDRAGWGSLTPSRLGSVRSSQPGETSRASSQQGGADDSSDVPLDYSPDHRSPDTVASLLSPRPTRSAAPVDDATTDEPANPALLFGTT